MIKNYKLIQKIKLSKINGILVEYEHILTKCKIICIENEDENKSFSISFKTVPNSLKGIAHILEHSIFCGSKKYNSKDPFNDICKYNITSYINASTSELYTYFSYTTINKFSFDQIMDVYLDSVFNPLIFENECSFMQEGIRFEISNKEDELIPSGIVYSEMQGELTDIDYFIGDKVKKTTLNKTIYKYDNFGEPYYILDAKHKDILDYYLKYYHPSNGLIILYGNLDFKEKLEYIDKNYLSKYEKKDVNFEYVNQEKETKLSIHKFKYPSNTKKGTYYVYTKLIPSSYSYLDCLALEVLVEVLFNYSSSFFEQRLINQLGIASNVDVEISSLKDKFFFLQLDNIDTSFNLEILNKMILNQVNYLLNKGLNKQDINSYLKAKIFEQTEVNINSQNYSQYLIEQILDSYYNLDDPYIVFTKLKCYKELLKRTDTNYFDQLFKSFFSNFLEVGNVFIFTSDSKYIEKENKKIELKLQEIKNQYLKDNQLDELIYKNNQFKNYLEKEGNTSKLQSIKLEQVNDIPSPIYPNIEKINGKNNIFYFFKNTNDIIYGAYRFDISNLDDKQLELIVLLDELYFELPTISHTSIQISKNINKLPCSVSTFINTLIDLDGKSKCYFEINFKCYKKDLTKVNEIIKECIFNTKFDNLKLIRQLCCKHFYGLDQKLLSRADLLTRILGLENIDKSYKINDIYLGIRRRNYLFKIITDKSNKNLENILSQLEDVIKDNFRKDNLSFSYTSLEKYYQEFKNVCLDFYNCCYETKKENKGCFYNLEKKNSIGFISPTSNNFVSYCGIINANSFIDGKLMLLANIINNDYLYPQIRLEQGGYFSQITFFDKDKFTIDAFYIDDIKKVLYTIKHLPEFINQIDYSKQELDGFKVSSLASYYKSVRYSEYNDEGFTNYIINKDINIIQDEIKAIKECKIEDLKEYSLPISKGIENGILTCIGTKNSISKAKDNFNLIKDINNKED